MKKMKNKFINYKKAQISVEYMTMFFISMIIFIIFISVFYNNRREIIIETNQKQLNEIALSIQNEIITASNMNNGYKRIFIIPSQLSSNTYNISNNYYMFWIESNNFFISKRIPSINGSLKKGTNIIKKENNYIFINK
jgi:uncharacterized protein (UPF0333 family)